MRWAAVIVLLLAILLAVTNPNVDDFAEYMSQEISGQVDGAADTPLDGALAAFAGAMSKEFAKAATRSNYIVASRYTMEFNGTKLVWLGIGKQFFRLQ